MYSYNQAGRVTAQHMDYDGGRLGYDATYSWDNEGRMTGINYGPQYGFTYDANGRLGGMQDVESGHGNATVATANYGVAGEMLGLSYFGYNETRTYNALLQMTHVTVPGMMDMQYLYTAGSNNGRIAQSIDGVTGETLTYGYDRLNRLSGVSGTWPQTYSYDGFGNLTGKSAVGAYPAMNASFDPLTNRQNGLSYDANGNVTANGAGYDVENRLAGDSTALYVYDHAGKRVEKRYQATEEYYFYGIGGQKLVTQVCQTTESGWGCGDRQYNVYFGGKLVKSKGVVVVTDRLGSVRANSNGERMSYYPYGEEKTTTADGREKFATYSRDNASTDYADQRYYGVGTGRFGTADPMGIVSASPVDPNSWNRYTYVQGDPINFHDPGGQNRYAPELSSHMPGAGCGAGWMTDASLEGPCDGGGGGGWSDGGGGGIFCGTGTMGFVPAPNPACYVPLPPPPPSPKPTCSIALYSRGVTTSNSNSNGGGSVVSGPGSLLGAAHTYLQVTSETGTYVVEGYVITTQASSNNLPVDHLDAETSDFGHGDNPANDHFYGSITGTFVCDWLSTITAASVRINAANVVYQPTGPNSNTAMYYILSRLPTTATPWFSGASNLAGWYAYPF